jgi:hypothetical protein
MREAEERKDRGTWDAALMSDMGSTMGASECEGGGSKAAARHAFQYGHFGVKQKGGMFVDLNLQRAAKYPGPGAGR